jgi:hypothetical protein
MVVAPKAATATMATIHPAVVLRLPLVRSRRTGLVIRMVPPLPWVCTRYNSTPSQPSRPARVTTNDGRRRRMMIVPWSMPMAAVAAIPTRIANGHGQLWGGAATMAVITAPMPAT